MNKLNRRILWILSILSFVGIGISYFYLPTKIPIHWDADWEIDQWANKESIFLLGMLPILVIAIFEFLPKFDPRRDNYKKHAKAYEILEITTVLLMIILDWVSVAASFQINTKIVTLIIPAIIGVMFVIIGNYLPTLKSNYFFGIKNPWTLSNDMVWRRTHKAGGYVFAILGILMVMMAFIQNIIFNRITITVMIVGMIGVNVYSYLIYRKLNK